VEEENSNDLLNNRNGPSLKQSDPSEGIGISCIQC